jgi:hypothetical protein
LVEAFRLAQPAGLMVVVTGIEQVLDFVIHPDSGMHA